MIEIIAETGSTNADLGARLHGGEFIAEGRWLVADRQTGGRGRQGRVWSDGAGNFMGSTIVHPAPGDPAPATLALVAGLALHGAVDETRSGIDGLQLKWPNDLMIGGAKVAGILLEREGNAVIVGIGVNLAAAPDIPDRPTIALAQYGTAPDRDAFAGLLAERFSQEIARWRGYGLAPILRRWAAVGHAPGTMLAVHDQAGTPLTGAFAGLADDGGLQLRLADGTTRTIHAGDVQFAAPITKEPGYAARD